MPRVVPRSTTDLSAVALQSSVDDLEGRLSAARALLLDNLDAAITSRASAADWTAARAARLDANISSRMGSTIITSVQYGTISLDATATGVSATATIASVNTAKAVVIPLGWDYNGSSISGTATYVPCRLTLTNGTTVTATAHESQGLTAMRIGFVVVEFV